MVLASVRTGCRNPSTLTITTASTSTARKAPVTRELGADVQEGDAGCSGDHEQRGEVLVRRQWQCRGEVVASANGERGQRKCQSHERQQKHGKAQWSPQ